MAKHLFNPSSSREERALQAWLVLIGVAYNRQLITYGDLAKKMYGRKAAGVIAGTLGCVAFYCQQNKLPTLTTIVVNGGRGRPGQGLPPPPRGRTIDRERELVFNYWWYNIVPPTTEQLDEALKLGWAQQRAASRARRQAGRGTGPARVGRARP